MKLHLTSIRFNVGSVCDLIIVLTDRKRNIDRLASRKRNIEAVNYTYNSSSERNEKTDDTMK